MLSGSSLSDDTFTFNYVDSEINSQVKIIYGVQGIGKTTILNYMAYRQAKKCIELEDDQIPIIITLRSYGLNKDIITLIITSLNKLGYRYNRYYFMKNLNNNNFLFYFDGFDEIQDKFRTDVLSEINDLIKNYPKHRYIITSRVTEKIQISLGVSFIIQRLSNENINYFCELNLGPRKEEFLHRVTQMNLLSSLRNTLILIFMIYIYKSGGKFPSTRARVIKEIINGVEKWEKEKIVRNESVLPWHIKQDLLEYLSYSIKNKNLNLTIFYQDFMDELIVLIEKYEKNREIPFGLDRKTILRDLHSTGILQIDDDGCTFRNIAFLEHFASISLSKLYQQNPSILKEIIYKLNWHNVIVATPSKIPDPNKFVEEVFSFDIMKGAACLIEASDINDSLINKIVTELANKCKSSIPIIRHNALFFLSKIDKKYTTNIYFNLIESEHDSVKMNAIEEISKLNTEESREIVNQYIDWDAGGFKVGDTTQGVLARSLSNFNEVSYHLQILEIWRKKGDIFTNTAVESALMNLIHTNKMSATVRDQLIKLFFEITPENQPNWWSKWRSIANILIEFRDESIYQTLIEGFSNDFETANARSNEISRILSTFRSNEIVVSLINKALSNEETPSIRAGCIRALVLSSNEIIDLDVFSKLMLDSDSKIRRNAVTGLSRFSFFEVEELLISALNDDDAFVHSESIKLFGSFGKLSLLITKSLLPEQIVLRTLLEEIKKYRPQEFVPYLLRMSENWLKSGKFRSNEREFLRIVDTLFSLGKKNEALDLLSNFYVKDILTMDNQYSYVDLAEMSTYFDDDLGLKILNDYYVGIKEYIKNRKVKSILFFTSRYIEILELFVNDESLTILMKLCEEYLDDIIILERTLRAIGKIGYVNPTRTEDWLIDFINDNEDLKGVELHRAIEVLGFYGTEKSFSIIKNIAIRNKNTNEYILNGCYYAYENILKAKNIYKFIDENIIIDVE